MNSDLPQTSVGPISLDIRGSAQPAAMRCVPSALTALLRYILISNLRYTLFAKSVLCHQPHPSIPCCSVDGSIQHTLLPVTRFEEEQLDEAIREMELLLEKDTPRLICLIIFCYFCYN